MKVKELIKRLKKYDENYEVKTRDKSTGGRFIIDVFKTTYIFHENEEIILLTDMVGT